MTATETCPCGWTLPQEELVDTAQGLTRLVWYSCRCGRRYRFVGARLVEEPLPPPKAFQCPRCGIVSHNPHDAEHGYCGRCHAFTGPGVNRKMRSETRMHGRPSR
jgi:hypothetical protein